LEKFLPFNRNHEILEEIMNMNIIKIPLTYPMSMLFNFASCKNAKLIWSFYKKTITSKKLDNLCKNLVLQNKIKFIKYLLSEEIKINGFYSVMNSIFINHAIHYNNCELFKYVIEIYGSIPIELYDELILYDRVEMFRLCLIYNSYYYDFEKIVLYDRLEILKVIVNKHGKDFFNEEIDGFKSTEDPINEFVIYKKILMIEYLIEDKIIDVERFIKSAEKNKNWKLMDSLTKKYLQ
jgi:hypothetical protein